jgi:uncharacterized OsmC-like protein
MATGEVELEGQVLVLKRIHVAYSDFSFTEEQRETVERVLSVHADGCPVARSLRGAIEITTTLSGAAVWNR